MKKKFFLVALSVLTLAACTNDEMIEEKQNEIKFAVTTETTTRAGAVATTTNTIDNFKVWAYTSKMSGGASGQNPTDDKLYINGTDVNKTNGIWEFADGSYFWPNSPLSFYAFSPSSYLDDEDLVSSVSAKSITCITDGNNDLLYASKIYHQRDVEGNSETVPLNFRHAFAQLIFSSTNSNAHLGVEVGKVEVAQMYTKGTLTMHNFFDTNSASDGYGEWTQQETIGTLEATLAIPEGETGIEVETLGGNAHEAREDWLTYYKVDNSNGPHQNDDAHTNVKGLYVLPQELKYWNPSKTWDATSTENKAYFIIYCKVWNKPELTTAADENAIFLWGDKDTYAPVAVPVVVPTTTTDADGNTTTTDTFTWEQGIKYKYTFNFAKGAGYIPPTDEYNPGEPVLVPIKVTITVDEFQSANPQPGIDMGTEE